MSFKVCYVFNKIVIIVALNSFSFVMYVKLYVGARAIAEA
jgi:hypothetical protein